MIADDTGRRFDQEVAARGSVKDKQKVDIMTTIEMVVRKLEWAQRENAELQRNSAPGSPEWHRHETIDDKLHEALAAIGQ